jgi:hypothetical protein
MTAFIVFREDGFYWNGEILPLHRFLPEDTKRLLLFCSKSALIFECQRRTCIQICGTKESIINQMMEWNATPTMQMKSYLHKQSLQSLRLYPSLDLEPKSLKPGRQSKEFRDTKYRNDAERSRIIRLIHERQNELQLRPNQIGLPLPPELRHLVYEELMHDPDHERRFWNPEKYPRPHFYDKECRPVGTVSILRVSKDIYKEAIGAQRRNLMGCRMEYTYCAGVSGPFDAESTKIVNLSVDLYDGTGESWDIDEERYEHGYCLRMANLNAEAWSTHGAFLIDIKICLETWRALTDDWSEWDKELVRAINGVAGRMRENENGFVVKVRAQVSIKGQSNDEEHQAWVRGGLKRILGTFCDGGALRLGKFRVVPLGQLLGAQYEIAAWR